MTHAARQALIAAAYGVSLAIGAAAAQAVAAPAATAEAPAKGVKRLQSAYGFDDTVARLKADIAAKGIRFFTEIDQSKLGEGANIPLRPSKLLLFGNPPLGVQFLTANPYAGLEVFQDAGGKVWVAYTDFRYIADRYDLKDRAPQIAMASEVAGSIAGSVGKGE
jgi:uncharacterized protein (DUF302 family)